MQNDPADRFAKRGNPAREGSPLPADFADYPFTEQVKTAYLDLVSSRLSASQSLTKGSNLYAYPAGTSFCSCASSRAVLHVGSLFLRNRQPSNAPPLLLSPTGRATRRGPQMQNTLGGTPRHPRSSGATSASIGQTLRYTAGSPPRCGASSSPHKVLRPCGDPISPLGTAAPSRSVG